MRHFVRRHRNWIPWLTGAGLVLVALAIFLIKNPLIPTEIGEDLALLADPRADRAYEYGVKHFDAIDARQYDIDRSEDLFNYTLRLDPSHPYAYHELARIAFLRGDQEHALMLINKEFEVNPKPMPASYYIRALIKGYMGDYLGAADDYETYFKVTSANWAAINDYSWVLLKAGDPADAHHALSWGLAAWPDNPWLLANESIALYELGRVKEADAMVRKAQAAVGRISELGWRIAYPGNDPAIASTGLANFRAAVAGNLETIERATATSTRPTPVR